MNEKNRFTKWTDRQIEIIMYFYCKFEYRRQSFLVNMTQF